MSDIGAIANAIEQFHSEYGFFPPSEDGKIKICKGENFNEVVTKLSSKKDFDRNLFFTGLRVCDWGKDAIVDLVDDSRSPYLSSLPQDPKTSEGFSYYYISNLKRYQIYTSLEGEKDEDTYNEGVVQRNLPCGSAVCMTGKAFSQTPIEISIEEYESKLLESSKK
jgi:hypothetical protein